MYQGREKVLKYEILLGLANQVKGPPIQRELRITSPFDLQCHTGAKEVKETVLAWSHGGLLKLSLGLPNPGKYHI